MIRESMIRRTILLLFFIVTIISAASVKDSIKGTSNSSNARNLVCISAPASCAYGICISGSCGPCPYDPLKCCVLSPGQCLSADGVPYGVCAPTCSCYGC